MHDAQFEQVTVVCVTYKSRSLIDFLAGTLALFPHVVVIDNGSNDGTAAEVRCRIPHARVIERASNSGFGAANNQAMRQVKTPFALLLNPDCRIEAADLSTLVDTLQHYPDAGVVGPQSYRENGSAQMCFRQPFFEVPAKKAPYQIADGTCSARWLHGCCLLFRIGAFQHIGGFDENFFLYYEDDDLCLRMQAAGFDCLFEPHARAEHLGGASSAPSVRTSFLKSFHYARSRHLAIRRYQGRSASGIYLAKILLAAVPASLVYGLLLRRKYFVRWLGWGCAAAASLCTRGVAHPPRET